MSEGTGKTNDEVLTPSSHGLSAAAASRSREVDIVARLRQFGVIEGTLPEDAAREIERLRAIASSATPPALDATPPTTAVTPPLARPDGIDPWSVEHTSKCRIHDHLFEENAIAADCSCGAILRSLSSELSSDATQDIRDFFKAVDSGWLGQMPSGFNQSAFVTALRSRLQPAAAGEAPSSAEAVNTPTPDPSHD